MLEFLTLHPQAFGLDISGLSVKAVQLGKKQKGFRLDSFGALELAPGVIEDVEIKKEEQHQNTVLNSDLKMFLIHFH